MSEELPVYSPNGSLQSFIMEILLVDDQHGDPLYVASVGEGQPLHVPDVGEIVTLYINPNLTTHRRSNQAFYVRQRRWSYSYDEYGRSSYMRGGVTLLVEPVPPPA